jgi:hypothetical protein
MITTNHESMLEYSKIIPYFHFTNHCGLSDLAVSSRMYVASPGGYPTKKKRHCPSFEQTKNLIRTLATTYQSLQAGSLLGNHDSGC